MSAVDALGGASMPAAHVTGAAERAGPVEAAPSDRGVILHIVCRFANGGSEQRVIDLVRAFPGYEHVLAVGHLQSPQRLASSDARVIEIPHLVRSVSPVSDVRAVWNLRGLVRALRPVLVVTHQSKGGAVGRVACRIARTGAPVAHSLSMSSLDEAGTPAVRELYRLVERALVPLTGAWLCVGDDLATQYQDRIGVPSDRMSIVRSSVDLSDFVPFDRREARRLLGLPEQPSVVYVGSFEERKGVLALVDILRLLRVRFGPLNALLVGEGPLRQSVVEGVGAIDGVDVTAPGHTAEVFRYMQAADALCLPSRAEGLPQVLVQAASVGLPFVAYRAMCGAAELIGRGADGVTVATGDAIAMAQALERAIRSNQTAVRHSRVDLSEWDPRAVDDRYRSILLSSSLSV